VKIKTAFTKKFGENYIREMPAIIHFRILFSSEFLSEKRKTFNTKVYRSVILLVALYGCETWVLRRIFGTKREEMAGGWRRLHNEELHNFYASPNVVRVIKTRGIRWAGNVASMVKVRSAFKILFRKLPNVREKWL